VQHHGGNPLGAVSAMAIVSSPARRGFQQIAHALHRAAEIDVVTSDIRGVMSIACNSSIAIQFARHCASAREEPMKFS
jgi:hypothetical protein